jgi:hypothetical protein
MVNFQNSVLDLSTNTVKLEKVLNKNGKIANHEFSFGLLFVVFLMPRE